MSTALQAAAAPADDDLDADAKQAESLGWLPALVLSTSAGLLVVAASFAAARDGRVWADPLFWAGLVAMVAPPAYRLLGREAGTRERAGVVLALGLLLYAVKLLHSPDGFTFHDEHGFVRSTQDIIATGSLYEDNPLVRAYSFYPGLPALTAALAQVTGLSVFASGLMVIGVARGLLVLSLFGFVARVTRSPRAAGIAVLIYVANPNFLFFDAQFAYESLAIGLAAAALLATAEARERGGRLGSALAGCAVLLGAATVLTHHITSYALVFALVTWAVLDRTSLGARRLTLVAPVALAVAGATAAWFVFAGDSTGNSIGPSLSGSVGGLVDIVTGASSGRAPFSGGSGYSDPPLERFVGLASVAVLLACLPPALWAAWKARRRHPALLVLALAAAAYPATLALRLTAAGAETSNRTSEFVFIGLGATIGLWLASLPTDRVRPARATALRLAASACATLIFLGGLIVGWPPYARLPGGYLVAGLSRSVDEQSLAAARWAGTYLPAESRMLADGSNKSLMIAFGDQDPQGGAINGVGVGSLLLSPTFTEQDTGVIVDDALRYLVIDRRLASARPRSGRYFDSGDPRTGEGGGYPRPLDPRALAKFDDVPGISKVYDNGAIAIYDARDLLRDNGREDVG